MLINFLGYPTAAQYVHFYLVHVRIFYYSKTLISQLSIDNKTIERQIYKISLSVQEAHPINYVKVRYSQYTFLIVVSNESELRKLYYS